MNSKTVDYIDYNKIKNLVYKIEKGSEFVTINCYYNGQKWLCPNPQNLQLCDQLDQWFGSTHLVKLRLINLPADVFNEIIDQTLLKNNNDIILSEL